MDANMCSIMVVCVLLPRFELAVAAGGREALAGGPLALAPETGREQLIGEASAAAEAFGVRAGLRLGEALARCPTLRLVAPDPAGVADEWDRLLVALEGIGAAVEPGHPGTAWFDAAGLRTIHGGRVEDVIAAARRALGTPARIGAAPSRFAALAAASRARARRPELAPEGPGRLAAYMAPLPVSLLASRPQTAVLPDLFERFGVRTLGELAALPRAALADRFGVAGPLARDLARGRDAPLRPRQPSERLEERLDLPESGSGPQLEQALGLLVDRLLARRERRSRTLRRVVLSAELVEGGTWRIAVSFREALADPRRMRLVLVNRLSDLPAPADALRLRVEEFGPPAGAQRSLLAEPAAIRLARLREAVRQVRAVAGPDAALRILAVDPDSRVPERRLALAPWEP
jgi:protein ImuB